MLLLLETALKFVQIGDITLRNHDVVAVAVIGAQERGCILISDDRGDSVWGVHREHLVINSRHRVLQRLPILFDAIDPGRSIRAKFIFPVLRGLHVCNFARRLPLLVLELLRLTAIPVEVRIVAKEDMFFGVRIRQRTRRQVTMPAISKLDIATNIDQFAVVHEHL